MDSFNAFKKLVARSVEKVRKRGESSERILAAVDGARDWDQLERALIEVRVLSRKRQQEVLARLAPLAEQAQAKLAEAKAARVRVLRDNLLRQAEGYLQQLEAEDEPARIHGNNTQLLTQLIKQVQRARALSDNGVHVGIVDGIGDRLEEVLVEHEEVADAAAELESIGRSEVRETAATESVERRITSLCDQAGLEDGECEAEDGERIQELEAALFGAAEQETGGLNDGMVE